MDFYIKHQYIPRETRAIFDHQINNDNSFEFSYVIDVGDLAPATIPTEEDEEDRWIQHSGEFQLTEEEIQDFREISGEGPPKTSGGWPERRLKYDLEWKDAGVDMPCAIEVLFIEEDEGSGYSTWLYHPDYRTDPVWFSGPENYCPSARTDRISKPSKRVPTEQIQTLYQFVRQHSEDNFTELLHD